MCSVSFSLDLNNRFAGIKWVGELHVFVTSACKQQRQGTRIREEREREREREEREGEREKREKREREEREKREREKRERKKREEREERGGGAQLPLR